MAAPVTEPNSGLAEGIGSGDASLTGCSSDTDKIGGLCGVRCVLSEYLYCVVCHLRIHTAVSYHLHYLGQEAVCIRRVVGYAGHA